MSGKILPKNIILFIYLVLKHFKALLACDYLTNVNLGIEM